MSTFNLAVPPLSLSPVFLRAINWAQRDDPQKKYPLMGRIRYAWLSDDMKRVKLLLKDGPNSFSEEKPEIMDQIKSHESFFSVCILKRDPVYLVAEFDVLTEHYDEHFKEEVLDDFATKMELIQTIVQRGGEQSITKDPFDIFDEVMKKLESRDAETLDRLKPLAESLMSAIQSSNGPTVLKVGITDIESQTLSEHLDEVMEKKNDVMKMAVGNEKYERAAEIRDEIDAIKKIKDK